MSEIKFCPECGAEAKPGIKFCGSCGINIYEKQQAKTAQAQPPAQPQTQVVHPKRTKAEEKAIGDQIVADVIADIDADKIVSEIDMDKIVSEIDTDKIVKEAVAKATRHVDPKSPQDQIYAKERKKLFRWFWFMLIFGVGILPGLLLALIAAIRGFKSKATWFLKVTGGVMIFWGLMVAIAGPIIATPILTGAIQEITTIAEDVASKKKR